MKFFYVYKALAHPETNGYITPFTIEERLMHVAEAKRKLGSRITWLCDTMDNDLKHALGDAPNSEFIIDPEGVIVKSRGWSQPEALRADLAALVGEVTPVTTIAELGMKPLEPPQTAPQGVVPRLQIPAGLVPLRVQPHVESAAGAKPFYVKLRAEGPPRLMQEGAGQVWLGFYLDPLHHVHWNNEAAPVRFEIDAPAGVEVTPAEGMAPDAGVPADADPREFLIAVRGVSDEPLRLTVRYFACDDAETFCVPVVQHYDIFLRQDRDGGRRRTGVRGTAGDRNGSGAAAGPAMPPRLRQMMQRFPLHRVLDQNRDGELSAVEREAASRSLQQLDRNGDGRLSQDELRPPAQRQQ